MLHSWIVQLLYSHYDWHLREGADRGAIIVASSSLEPESLSVRERQIAEAYAAGNSYRKIAERLFIAPATVRTHLSTIYRKLGVSTKIELLRALEGPSPPTAGAPAPKPSAVAAPARRYGSGKRQVTVLCAMPDRLPGIIDSFGPEETAAVVGLLRRTGEEAVARHGGELIGGHVGDVTACFGLPASDETDAERAVECALSIRENLRRHRGPDGNVLDARIGLFTGPVVAHDRSGGGELVGGATPYLAAALAREAKGGGVVVCARTRAVLGGLFAFDDLGPIEIDSGPDVMRSFGVTEATPSETRFEALHGYRLSPFVGRDREVALLESLFERATVGEGQAVLISGEPGIGKSRMIRALSDRLALAPEAMLFFQCSPHEQTSPLHPVARSLRQAAGVNRHGDAEGRLDALAALLGAAIETRESDRQLVAELASIRREPPVEIEPLPPEKRRAAMLALLDRFLCRRAVAGPLLVVFEDMHWADPTTTHWFERVLGLIETLPVLVLATARPEFVFQPAGRPNVTVLTLARLRRDDVMRIVADQAGARSLAPALVARIAIRAEGVPLFAEELTRAILELGETEHAVPATLQASLMGRLDRLGLAREVAQAAAVIGRDFERDLLAEIVPHGPRGLEKALDALLASRLVLQRPTEGAGAMQFKHALVRDAAYDSLLRARRESLHLALAETLLATRGSGREVAPELIAGHLIEGGEPGRSVPLLIEAARAALWKGADSEAELTIRKALKASEAIGEESVRLAAVCDLQMLLYVPIYRRGDVRELLDIVTQAEATADRLGDPVRLSKATYCKTFVLANAGRVDEAIETGRRGVRISEGLDDDETYVGPIMTLGRALYAAGWYREAALQIRKVRDFLGMDIRRGRVVAATMNQVICSRAFLTFIQSELGEFNAAERDIDEAFQLLPQLRTSDHERVLACAALGRLLQMRGDHNAVIDRLEPVLDHCRRNYPVYLSRLAMSLGPALVNSGQAEHGIALLAEADTFSERNQFHFFWALLLAQYSRALLMTGDAAQSEAIARRATRVAADAGEVGNGAWARLAAGEALTARGQMDEARALIGAAAVIAAEREMVPLLRICRAALGSAA